MGVRSENSKTKGKSLRAVIHEQYRYAWTTMLSDLLRQPWSTLFTTLVIAISLALPTACYLIWKNINVASEQWYPTPQVTVYLEKTLSSEQSQAVADELGKLDGVKSIIYLPKDQALNEFREWSGFEDALNMLEVNPLPAVVMLLPDNDNQTSDQLKVIRQQSSTVNGVEDVRLDDGWFTRLTALTGLIALMASILAALMIIAVFLVIGNSIRLTIFSRRDTINVMKLIGATDGFILRPFLNGGALLGFLGALTALLVSQLLIWGLNLAVSRVVSVFSTEFSLQGISWEEALLLLLISTMIGWVAAWLATMKHLKQFAPE